MKKQLLNPWLVSGCILSISLTTASLAIARYVPPRSQKPPSDYTRTGGGRGCPQDKIPLTILAPKKHIGETTSRYPTFAWFVSNSYPVEFQIFEFDAKNEPSKSIGQPVLVSSSSGINKYSLPENQPGLTVGQKYLLQTVINCQQEYLVERAEFTVVEMPSSLSKQLSITKDGTKKADLYAEAGLWYDAFDEALKLSHEKKPAKIVSTLLQDLATLEEPDATKTLTDVQRQEMQKRSDRLRQISNSSPTH
ncbi:DUF928 domain-containing protein [Scytonema sp. UIC 10036]|uniref:DUF928 domain-containing protein n=1 Tax=Scytonema sp. UIC 10036 TaxID=2304196 RepID=UPI0012DA606F|nr:DUF928 domain-containing protein [Scytonema sp. UIC 10036]MUG91062.1 DUF928 domain-containing protein [Scytonema sp. UIC 10036]